MGMNIENEGMLEQPVQQQQDIKQVIREETGQFDVSPNLVAAYSVNIGKAVFFIAALIGAFYMVQYLTGSNPFIEVVDLLGIPMMWLQRAAYVLIALFFIAAFFSTLSLASYELIFDGNTLNYSYGSFLKVSRSTPVTNIMRVNFKEYSPLSLGELTLELSGTEDKSLTVQFVSHVKEKGENINNLINQYKSSVVQKIDNESDL